MKFLQMQMNNFILGIFWIGMLQSLDGEWIWQDGTEVDFVNWNAEDPQSEMDTVYNYYHHYNPHPKKWCVAVNSEHGKWITTHCSNQANGYICKTSQIFEARPTAESSNNRGAEKEESSSSAHGTVVMVVIFALLILTAAGISGYVFYKKRRRQQVTIADHDKSVYRDNVVMLQNDNPENLVENFDNKHGH